MNNEELLADLKQFITATVSQATANVATKSDINHLETTMDDRFNEVLNVLGEDAAKQKETVQDHEVRIQRLERKLA